MEKLSVIVIAGSEEQNIAGCLDSVRDAGEIIVLCSSTEDRTMDIAREFTPHVHFREFTGFAAQKQASLDLATRPWVLSLDAAALIEAVGPTKPGVYVLTLTGTMNDGTEILGQDFIEIIRGQ